MVSNPHTVIVIVNWIGGEGPVRWIKSLKSVDRREFALLMLMAAEFYRVASFNSTEPVI